MSDGADDTPFVYGNGAYVPIFVHQHMIGHTDHLSSACLREFLQM